MRESSASFSRSEIALAVYVLEKKRGKIIEEEGAWKGNRPVAGKGLRRQVTP